MNLILTHLKNMLAGRSLPSQKAWISVDWNRINLFLITFLAIGSMFTASTVLGMEKKLTLANEIRLNKQLIAAATNGNLDVLKECIESGADIDAQGKDGHRAIIYAIWNGHKNIFQYLVESKAADIDTKDNEGRTVLNWAAGCGVQEAVELLITHGANKEIRDCYDESALMRAVEGNYKEIVQLLIEAGANVNDKKKDGFNILMIAAYKNYKEIVEYLIQKGADINAKHIDGSTPLIYAAQLDKREIVKYLIKSGATINTQDKKGRTALIIAAINNHQSCCELLVEAMLRQFTDAQKKQAFSLLFCLKKGDCGREYSNLKKIFKPYVCQIFKKENAKSIIMEVNTIDHPVIKQHLLSKYFCEK